MVSSLPFVLIMYMVGSKFIVHGFSKSLIPVNHYYPQHKYICKSCRGKRVVLGTKSVKLNIMPGISFFVVNFYFLALVVALLKFHAVVKLFHILAI